LDAISNAETPEELNEAFNLLQGFLGGTADQARRAANEMQGLIDKLDELTGSTRDVDEAQRQLNDSFNDVLESFGRYGAGIDANTDAGRRNAAAIQDAVESAEALAEAQARTDLSGESSRQTLQNLANQLLGLRDAGLLTQAEYERLLELYDLTPKDITTTVNADTAEAQGVLNDLRTQIEEMPGVPEPVKARLLAELNQGNLDQVEASIAFLARQREAIIRINPVLPEDSILQGFPIFNPGGVAAGGRGTDAAGNIIPGAPFGRATGGPVKPGEAYMVGELGPELIVPEMAGTVLTADQTAGLLGDTKTQGGSEFSDAMLAQIAAEMRAQTRLLANVGTNVDVRAESGVRVTAKQRARSTR
jgi:hypothetical protein